MHVDHQGVTGGRPLRVGGLEYDEGQTAELVAGADGRDMRDAVDADLEPGVGKGRPVQEGGILVVSGIGV